MTRQEIGRDKKQKKDDISECLRRRTLTHTRLPRRKTFMDEIAHG